MKSQSIKVLLVEDDEDDYLLTRMTLQEIEGVSFDLHWANSFVDGLYAVEAFRPDICLVDYYLGEHTGLEFIGKCRSRLHSLPMILLTGSFDRQVDLEATAAGAMDYLVKSQINPQLLERSIRYASERHKTVGKLQELAAIVQSSDDAIVGKTLEGIITSWNEGAERIYGYKAEEIVGKSIYIIVPQEYHAEVAQILERLRKGERVRHLETRRLRKDGTIVNVSVTVSPIKDYGGTVIGASAIARDITEGKRTVESLKQSVERFDLVARATSDTIWDWNLITNEVWWNENFQTMFGYAADEIRTDIEFWTSRVHPDDVSLVMEDIHKHIEAGCDSWAGEYRFRRGDGTYTTVADRGYLVHDEDGKSVRMVGSMMDITESRLAEEAREELAMQLASTVQAYQQVMDNSLDVICTVDAVGRFLQVSRASEEVWGYKPEELVGLMYIELVHPDDRPKTNEAAAHIMSGIAMRDFDNRYIRKDGSEVCLMWSAAWSEESKMMFCVARDMTEVMRSEEVLRKTEDQLRQSQKMEAIGTLAGGMAHDFNNLLTAIKGYADLSMRKLRAEDPLFQNLAEIQKAAERAASLTRQLLAFSRRQILQPKVLDLNSIVSETEKMLRRLIGEDVEFNTLLEPALGSVRADPGQLEQVLMNLVVNARDAMPEGGAITIETHNVHLDDNYVSRQIAVIPGPYVLLVVSDTGHGMDEKTKAHIFEPFFTTKGEGKGTGLGLSTVYGIVQQSGGNIWVYSEVGQGTTFKIYLPRLDAHAVEYSASVSQSDVIGGKETILLAEDDELVRNLTRQILEESRYTVLEGANGGAALMLCERHEHDIHLLLTDVVMPEMSGRELAERLALIRPEMKVIYMSGYTEDAVVRRGIMGDETNFIQKPFSPDELLRKVRKTLDSPERLK